MSFCAWDGKNTLFLFSCSMLQTKLYTRTHTHTRILYALSMSQHACSPFGSQNCCPRQSSWTCFQSAVLSFLLLNLSPSILPPGIFASSLALIKLALTGTACRRKTFANKNIWGLNLLQEMKETKRSCIGWEYSVRDSAASRRLLPSRVAKALRVQGPAL